MVLACEDLSTGNGKMLFLDATVAARREIGSGSSSSSSSLFPVTMQKRVYSNEDTGHAYLNYTKKEVLAAPTDVLGNHFLGIHGFPPRAEPTWEEVAAAIPPIRSIGAFGNGAGNPRVWTANRESGRDIVFDSNGGNHLSGAPGPANVLHILTGLGNVTRPFNGEGTVVGTPAIVLNFPPANGTNVTLWEMSVVPVPNNTGFVQPVFVRFLQVSNTAPTTPLPLPLPLPLKEEETKPAEPPKTLYFDSMTYMPSKCTGDPYDDEVAGCDAPGNYFAALLDNHFYWQTTWEEEGRMTLDLPSTGGTDGGMLTEQSQHAIILDMITRTGGVWPRYGTYPGYDQPDDGQEEIFTATMMTSLEWGLFKYAADVLDNYLTSFVHRDGTILYAITPHPTPPTHIHTRTHLFVFYIIFVYLFQNGLKIAIWNVACAKVRRCWVQNLPRIQNQNV